MFARAPFTTRRTSSARPGNSAAASAVGFSCAASFHDGTVETTGAVLAAPFIRAENVLGATRTASEPSKTSTTNSTLELSLARTYITSRNRETVPLSRLPSPLFESAQLSLLSDHGPHVSALPLATIGVVVVTVSVTDGRNIDRSPRAGVSPFAIGSTFILLKPGPLFFSLLFNFWIVP